MICTDSTQKYECNSQKTDVLIKKSFFVMLALYHFLRKNCKAIYIYINFFVKICL